MYTYLSGNVENINDLICLLVLSICLHYRPLHRKLSENIFQMVSTYTNIYKSKCAYVIQKGVHTTQQHKAIASVHQGMVDQLIGVPTNFTRLGINSVQTSFTTGF